jgi:uracil-DNA glycosylase family protein
MAIRRKSPPDADGAEAFLPSRLSLETLRDAAASCQGCALYLTATQTVFGEGRASARVMFVGEQPGDLEDQRGRPFVGPAGRLFDKALVEAGIERNLVYVTNAVKHFKFEQRGKARLHKRPKAGEIAACLPWLRAELKVVRPDILVLLGATAAQALFGARFRVTRERGQPITTDLAEFAIATAHPSSILRAPDDDARAEAFRLFVADLKLVAQALKKLAPR